MGQEELMRWEQVVMLVEAEAEVHTQIALHKDTRVKKIILFPFPSVTTGSRSTVVINNNNNSDSIVYFQVKIIILFPFPSIAPGSRSPQETLQWSDTWSTVTVTRFPERLSAKRVSGKIWDMSATCCHGQEERDQS